MAISRARIWVAVLAACVVVPEFAFAQASITGTVRDTSGAVLPGVSIEASSPALIEKVRTAVTDGAGQYRIEALRPGAYAITFSLAGFSGIRREGIELSGSFVATVNVEMRLGALEETVTVSGASPVVDVQSATRQRVLDSEVIAAVPSGRLHTSLAVLIPGVASNQQDVGGSNIGQFAPSLTIHGSRATDTRFTINGLSPANGEGGGQSVNYTPNMSSTQEMTIDTSGWSAEESTGGLRINLIPREGGNVFSGTFYAWGANSSLQSTNYTPELKARGLGQPDSLVSSYDINPGVGGPIVRDRLWFFSAARWNRVTNIVGGAFPRSLNAGNVNEFLYVPDPNSPPGENSTYFRSVNSRVTWQVSAKDKVSVFYDDQDRCTCPNLVVNQSLESASPHYGIPGWFTTANWTSPRTNRLLLEAGLSIRQEAWHTAREQEVDPELIGVTEQSTGLRYRTHHRNPIYTGYEQNLKNARFSASYVTGSHALKVGITDAWSSNDRFNRHNNYGLSYRFNNGRPNQLTLLATPFDTSSNIKYDLGIFAQDKWSISKLSVNVGMRVDLFNLYYPEQHLGPGVLVPNRDITFPRTEGINWKDVTPRLGAAYDIFGDGKTAVKVSLNKYMGGVAHQAGNPFNPVSRLANTTTRSWSDNDSDFRPDCDLTNPAQNGECGAMAHATFGLPTPTTTYDPETLSGWGRRFFNWEFSAGVQREVLPRVSLDVGYFRRWYGNFTVTDNLAVSAADYDPFTATAPQDSRLPDGGGYPIAGLYDLDPTRVGQVNEFSTFASEYGKQIDRWNGVDVTINARPLAGAVFQGGFSTGRAVTDNCEIRAALPETGPLNPYCHTNSGFVSQYKFLGTYVVPKIDVQLSGTFQGLPGPLLTANFNVPNAAIQPSLGRPLSGNAANATVNLVQPGALYGERLNQLDLRVGKIFKMGRTRTTVGVDVFNVLNANTVLAENSNYAAWRAPLGILLPRYARFSAQLDF
jgi:hypothetical protein